MSCVASVEVPAAEQINICDVQPMAASNATNNTNIPNNLLNLSLPTFPGPESDLKYINSYTLCNLIKGKYPQIVDFFRIIDCRYPYEYEGGHITGAMNLYKKDQIINLFHQILHSRAGQDFTRKDALIFHCEFSSVRGPRLARFFMSLQKDILQRDAETMSLPEVYVLFGGYKNFFSSFFGACTPQRYTPMLHQNYARELQRYQNETYPDRDNKISYVVIDCMDERR